jgi:plasmid stabilization system protein ParE
VTRAIRFASDAVQELREARAWYERQRLGLGDELERELRLTLTSVAERPESFAPIAGVPGVRKALVARFPYIIVFKVTAAAVRVLAVAHAHRKPAYWTFRR